MKKLIVAFAFLLPFLANAQFSPTGNKAVFDDGKVYAQYVSGTEYLWQYIVGAIVVHADETSLKETVINYIRSMSDIKGLNQNLMVKIGSCESWDYKEDVINNIQLGDDGKSMGVFQWQVHSWKYYTKIYNLDLDRTKWIDQVRLTTLVARDYGTKKDWTNCTRYAETGTYINKK